MNIGRRLQAGRYFQCALLSTLAIVASLADMSAQGTRPGKVVLYAAAGPELVQYDVDMATAALTKRATVKLPAPVQEGWAHPSKPILYVTWSDRLAEQSGGAQHGTNGLTAFTIDSTGGLHVLGTPVRLTDRAIMITLDVPAQHLLVAYNDPPGVTVHNLEADGSLASEVRQPSPLALGIYPHHVRVDPSNKAVIVPSRGWAPSARQVEVPGQIDVFAYDNGVLTKRETVAPGGGKNFQVRHVDFHPSRPFAYVTLEAQNKLLVFQRTVDGMLGMTPLFSKDTTSKPGASGAAASIHVHPNGRFVYTSNRGGGRDGGENSIAVFQINPETGEPTRIQNADTRGFSPRTFGIDPSGQLLVVANESTGTVGEGSTLRSIPQRLTVFRIQDNGQLEYVRNYDIEADPKTQFRWMILVPLR
jgi:6-phosphogluconolactonase